MGVEGSPVETALPGNPWAADCESSGEVGPNLAGAVEDVCGVCWGSTGAGAGRPKALAIAFARVFTEVRGCGALPLDGIGDETKAESLEESSALMEELACCDVGSRGKT